MIAYILDQFPSPTETFIAREIDALRRRGLDIRVFALNAGNGATPIARSIVGRVTNKLRHDERAFEKLGATWWRDCRAELGAVRHFHGAWASHPAEIAWGAARASGVGWSFSGHARDLWVDGRRLGEKIASARFAAACTRDGAMFLRAQAPDFGAKILYAPHGLQMAHFPFPPQISAVAREQSTAPLHILSVGRLVPKKGSTVLLRALQRIPFDFRCELIGDGPLRARLEEQCARDGLSSRVFFAGALDEFGVRRAMSEADVLVHAGLIAPDGDRDGLPNVLLEAAALGLPIITTTAGSVADFCDETIARLCAPDDDAALVAALSDVRDDWPATLARRDQARRRVESLFDIERNIDVLARAFADARQNSPAKSA